MAKNYFVYGCEAEEEVALLFKPSVYAKDLIFMTITSFLEFKEVTLEDRVVVYAERAQIKEVFEYALIYGFSVAIVAKESQPFLRETFEIPKEPLEALKIALEGECKKIDLLYCKDEIVLWGALVGEAPPHGVKSASYLKEGTTFWGRMKALLHAFKKIVYLKKAKVTIKTFKEQEIKTVVSGVVIIEHDDHSCASNLVKEFVSVSNGKILALLVSPSSVMDYLHYLYKAIFRRTKTLPNAVGIILSERLEIESEPPLPVRIDGEERLQTPVVFDVHKKAIFFCASQKFWEKEDYRQSDEKEVIKLGSLPINKEELEYSSEHIPIFTHAGSKQYQELFSTLREEARASSTFLTLMVLSTMLATVGLFLNSASVIIGAMLLAPLMQPIVAFSMGLLRFDMDLFWHGLKSVAIGVSLVLMTSSLFALLLPFENITQEIAGRLHPTLLDLIVAMVSGVAAAYAKNNPKIIGSLAGVSIAVALVPPISTAGIGIGWGSWHIFQNAFLLFLTNFVGIVFAAALSFVVLGFSPIKRAKNGLLAALALLVVISVPLYLSFSYMATNAKMKALLEKSSYLLDGERADLENVRIFYDNQNHLVIRCDLISNSHLNKRQRGYLKRKVAEKIDPYMKDKELLIEASELLRY